MPFEASDATVSVLFLRNIRGIEQPSGGEVYLANLARKLPEFGVHMHFLFATRPGGDHETCLDLFRDAGATFDVCPVPSAFSRADYRALKQTIRSRKPDILHTIDHRSDLLGAMVHKDVPVVASFLGWTNFTPGSFRWNVYGTIDRFALRKMDLIFYDSPEMIRNLGAIADGPNTRHVPNGIDMGRFVPDRESFADDGPLTFIQIARFHPNKGQLDFVRAAHAASAQRDGLRFILVGNAGPVEEGYEREVREFVRQNNMTNVEFTGPVPHTALVGLISRSDVLAAPSHVEGLSYAVLEAMAMQRGVLCYGTGGLREALDDETNALIVKTGDIDAFAAAMVRLHDDRALGRRISRAGQELVAGTYSLNAMAGGVAAGYREVLAKRNA